MLNTVSTDWSNQFDLYCLSTNKKLPTFIEWAGAVNLFISHERGNISHERVKEGKSPMKKGSISHWNGKNLPWKREHLPWKRESSPIEMGKISWKEEHLSWHDSDNFHELKFKTVGPPYFIAFFSMVHGRLSKQVFWWECSNQHSSREITKLQITPSDDVMTVTGQYSGTWFNFPPLKVNHTFGKNLIATRAIIHSKMELHKSPPHKTVFIKPHSSQWMCLCAWRLWIDKIELLP